MEKYEINPDRNHGLSYAYHQVERRKEERKKLTGHGCIECENVSVTAHIGAAPLIAWTTVLQRGRRDASGQPSSHLAIPFTREQV